MNLSAVDLAAALERREVRAEHLLRERLELIARREPEVRAFAHLDPAPAIERARQLDAGAVAGPLHGLPIGVKDLFDTSDLPTAYGSPIWQGHRPRADAGVVAACRAAGALIPGKTVTTEFAAFAPGPTRNPHDPGRTPGGSSSGSAAAVAAGFVPLAIGTQTAASIVRPAAYCGVVGFKPTVGLVGRSGVKLQSETLDTIGGFAATVEDVALLASVLTGDEALRLSRGEGAGTGAEVDRASGARVGLFRGPHWDAVGHDVQALWDRVARKVGREVASPHWFAPLTAWQIELMQREAAHSLAWEHAQRSALLSDGLRAMLDAGAAIDGGAHRRRLDAVRIARRQAEALFEHHDVLLTPSAAGEAGAWTDGTGDPLFGRAWTLLGLPCLHLPLGTGSAGLPIGLQVVGPAGGDARVLRAGAWLHGLLRGQG
jgi:Asp-tRNA(Asn)/Glu-tRNA(Gln) amidotransferase A subunit family amidase